MNDGGRRVQGSDASGGGDIATGPAPAPSRATSRRRAVRYLNRVSTMWCYETLKQKLDNWPLGKLAEKSIFKDTNKKSDNNWKSKSPGKRIYTAVELSSWFFQYKTTHSCQMNTPVPRLREW